MDDAGNATRTLTLLRTLTHAHTHARTHTHTHAHIPAVNKNEAPTKTQPKDASPGSSKDAWLNRMVRSRHGEESVKAGDKGADVLEYLLDST